MTATARSVALEAIRRVTDGGAYSTRVLPALLARSGLPERDRALATELTFGTLRRLLGLDRAIGICSTRPVSRMSPGARAVVRLGAYQLAFTRIPPHAAVGESVGLADPRERGFVNAVLRRLAEDAPPAPVGDAEEDAAARTGMAPWAIRELRKLLGEREAEVAAEALGERALLCLRTNPCTTSVGELTEALRSAGNEPRPGALVPECLLLDGGDPARLPGFNEGWFAVQDQASAFVVQALGVEPGARVFDACAAPGGKSAQAACLAGPNGLVVASDIHPERTSLIRATGKRLGVRILALSQDATRPAIHGGFDRVLVDAPCSGVGSARRRPELLWRSRAAELSGLARRQVEIAAAAADLLRPGGRLVYSVCTFPRAETDAACDALRRHRPALEPVAIDGPRGREERIRLWPHLDGADGMFLAAFTKRS